MKLFLSSIIFIIFIIINKIDAKQKSILLNKPECSEKRLIEADQALLKLTTIGPNGRKFPESIDQLPKFCKETNNYIDTISKFIDECYGPDEQRVFKIVIFSAKRSMKPYCGRKRSKKTLKLIESLPCLNSVINKIDCIDKFSNRTYEMIPYQIGKDKINYACCYFVDAIKCTENALNIPCMSTLARETFMDSIRQIAGDAVNFACGDYNESTDRCDHMPKLPKDKFDKTYKRNKNLKSAGFSQIMMIESIGGFAPEL